MVTVAMLGILAVIALPSVLEALQRRQVIDAGQAVLDLVEYARVQAASRNLAYEIMPYNETRGACGTLPPQPGSLQVWENTTPSCFGFFPATPPTASCVRSLDLKTDFPTISMLATIPANLAAPPLAPLCIKPDGRVFQVQSDQVPVIIPSTDDFAGGSARFRMQRVNPAGVAEGPIHAVVIPFSGLARVVVE
jgi:type II secretory pathway pseudopilin PulG